MARSTQTILAASRIHGSLEALAALAAVGGSQATVTMPNGEKIIGRVVRADDFLVILTLANGTRRAIPIENGVPKVEVSDPQMAHKKMVIELDDSRDNNMHNVTAYLATLK